MSQPDGYVQPGKEHLVCRLKKSLYGLKQSPRCWYQEFEKYMKSLGFIQTSADPCVFIRTGNNLAILAVYVDDLILMTKSLEDMDELKSKLSIQFRMKDMGSLHYCLGISVVQDEDKKCIWLHQKQYILSMLQKFGMNEAKPVSTPADNNVRLQKDDGISKPVDPVRYQSLVGSLLYAAIATRPDISQAVGAVSKYCAKPNEQHLTAVKRIIRYLKGTVDIAIRYHQTDDELLIGYADADFANDVDDRHSTSGTLFLMVNGPVSWLSKKQPVVALSTAEAEYIALSSATQEAIWFRKLLGQLSEVTEYQPIILKEDNQGAITMAQNHVPHGRTKHIDVKYHFVHEAIQQRLIELKYCPTDNMIADLLTKPLLKGQFEKLRFAMGMDVMCN